MIIPVHNKAALTKQCLDSILESPPETPFELIVVDDASTDRTPEILDSFAGRVNSLRLPTNAGFASACNAGAEAAASSEYLLFLNNDTIASEDWLDALTRYADARPEVAVVGSKLLFPDGTIQHAGVVFNLAGDPLHIYAGCAADHPAVNRSRSFQAVTAACCLVRRAGFDEAGGFDTAYENDLEDVDLCLRLAEVGLEVHYCHESVLVHLESASRGRPSGAGRSANVYRERWGNRVRADELSYYLEDGLLDVLRTRPDKLPLSRRRRADADVLQARTRQLSELLRETVRTRTLAAPDRASGRPRNAMSRSRLSLDGRKRLELRISELRNELSSSLSDSLAGVGGVGESPPKIHEDASSSALPTAYDGVVRDLPPLVARETEAGSTILVVSKGDDRLLRIEGRSGWHFPRTADGRYAGYHPADSEEAVAHLERLRQQGADYILFPQTSLWWLDHYSGLKRHLEAKYEARSTELGALFDVRTPRAVVDGASTTNAPGDSERADAATAPVPAAQTARPLASIVGGLLPDDARLAVTIIQSHGLGGLLPSRAAAIPLDEDETLVLAAVQERATAGSQFLVVPHEVFGWLADRPSLASELRARYRLITRQKHLCEIYDLRLGAPHREQQRSGV